MEITLRPIKACQHDTCPIANCHEQGPDNCFLNIYEFYAFGADWILTVSDVGLSVTNSNEKNCRERGLNTEARCTISC